MSDIAVGKDVWNSPAPLIFGRRSEIWVAFWIVERMMTMVD